jgi:hypothetical protein
MLPDLRLHLECFERLMAWDEELARQVAAARCPHCGGPLHQANYWRKPRGALLAEAGEAFRLRHSLCCGREGCRKRSLPPSAVAFASSTTTTSAPSNPHDTARPSRNSRRRPSDYAPLLRRRGRLQPSEMNLPSFGIVPFEPLGRAAQQELHGPTLARSVRPLHCGSGISCRTPRHFGGRPLSGRWMLWLC